MSYICLAMVKSNYKKLDAKLSMRYEKFHETELMALAKKSNRKIPDYIRLLIEYASKNKIKL